MNKNILLLVVVLALSGCTGSLETDSSPVRLVVSINPNATGSVDNIACNGQNLAIPKSPALVVLDTNRFLTNSSNPCGTITSLTGAAFQTINGLEVTGFPSVFVSIPTQSTVKQFTFQNNATPLKERNNFIPAITNGYCPSQLVTGLRTSNELQKLGILDNPYNDINTNCVSSSSKKPRVLVFNVPTIADPPTAPILLAEIDLSALNFIDTNNNPISIAIFNNFLYVLGTFTGQYRVRRYDLTAAKPSESFITTDFFTATATNAKLTVVQNRILMSFSDNFTGKVLPLIEDPGVTPNTIRFGDELRAGSTASDPVIGKTTAIRSASPSSSGFTLYLRPDNVLFQQSSQFASSNLTTGIDATFPPDNSIWVLNSNFLFKADTRDFPTQKPRFDAGIDFTGLNPGNVVWVFDEN